MTAFIRRLHANPLAGPNPVCSLPSPLSQSLMLFIIVNQDVDVSSMVFTERMASVLRSLNSSINASIALLSISPHLTMVSMSTVSALNGLKT